MLLHTDVGICAWQEVEIACAVHFIFWYTIGIITQTLIVCIEIC